MIKSITYLLMSVTLSFLIVSCHHYDRLEPDVDTQVSVDQTYIFKPLRIGQDPYYDSYVDLTGKYFACLDPNNQDRYFLAKKLGGGKMQYISEFDSVITWKHSDNGNESNSIDFNRFDSILVNTMDGSRKTGEDLVSVDWARKAIQVHCDYMTALPIFTGHNEPFFIEGKTFGGFSDRMRQFATCADHSKPCEHGWDHPSRFNIMYEIATAFIAPDGFDLQYLATECVNNWASSPRHAEIMLDPDSKYVSNGISIVTYHWTLNGRPHKAHRVFCGSIMYYKK